MNFLKAAAITVTLSAVSVSAAFANDVGQQFPASEGTYSPKLVNHVGRESIELSIACYSQ